MGIRISDGKGLGIFATSDMVARIDVANLNGVWSRPIAAEKIDSSSSHYVTKPDKINRKVYGPLALCNYACKIHANITPETKAKSHHWHRSSTLSRIRAGDELTIDYYDGVRLELLPLSA